MIPTTEELETLGFKTAASKMVQQRNAVSLELREKLRIAFEHFRVVKPEKVKEFGVKLKRKTFHRDRVNHRLLWQQPVFTPIERYESVPPKDVLVALQKAKDLNCFDRFEILTLGQASEYEAPRHLLRDPILFGRIDGSDNRYFIAQWDDDVSIQDILTEDEG